MGFKDTLQSWFGSAQERTADVASTPRGEVVDAVTKPERKQPSSP